MKLSIACLLVIGIMVTLWDYNNWRHIERDHFGQGQRESDIGETAAKLTNIYSNSFARVRFKYPQIWEVSENPEFAADGFRLGRRLETLLSTKQRPEIIRVERPFASYTVRPYLAVEVEHLEVDPNVWINQEAQKHQLTEERSIINTDKDQLVVLTWDEDLPTKDQLTVQEALSRKEDRMYIFKAVTEKGVWKTYKNTFWEMYKSVVLL